VALEHRLEAQSKKKMKNKARLPRTAGLRTITDLTTDLTKAGLDPSRVQERATMIAKMRGASARKRRRDEDEDGMDVDGDDDEAPEEGEGDAMMDVDGEWEDDDDDDTPRKRGKANSGAAIARKRGPRSNRQLAGMRDEAVRSRSCPLQNMLRSLFGSLSKLRRLYGCEMSASVSATCSQKQARATALSESKWCVFIVLCLTLSILSHDAKTFLAIPAETSLLWETEVRQNQPAIIAVWNLFTHVPCDTASCTSLHTCLFSWHMHMHCTLVLIPRHNALCIGIYTLRGIYIMERFTTMT
jgi:hypothetical protein